MTETELHQAVQQWQNGDKPACWQVDEWLWQRLNAAAVRFVYTLLDPHLEDYDRMQQATDLARNAFWAAMEEMDLKVSGGKLLVTPTGRQKSVKGELRDLFLGVVSQRKVTKGDSLQWRGLEGFAALFWDIWLLRCRDTMRSTIPTYKGTTQTYNPRTGKMDETPTRKAWERRSLEPTRDKHDDERGGSISEEEMAGVMPDGETILLAKERWEETVALAKKNVQERMMTLEQITRQSREQRQKSVVEVGNALLDYEREQLEALSTKAPLSDTTAAKAWEFVRDRLKLNDEAYYQRKSRFLKAVKDADSPQASVLLAYLQTKHEER